MGNGVNGNHLASVERVKITSTFKSELEIVPVLFLNMEATHA